MQHLGVLLYNPNESSLVESLDFENVTDLGNWTVTDLQIFELEPETATTDNGSMFVTPPTSNETKQGKHSTHGCTDTSP